MDINHLWRVQHTFIDCIIIYSGKSCLSYIQRSNWWVVKSIMSQNCGDNILNILQNPSDFWNIVSIDQAHRVLRVLRGPNWNVTAELTDIKVAAEKSKATKRTWKLRDFLEKTVWKPFLIAVIMMYFFQLTAINIVLMFTPDIFKMADPTSKFIDKFLGTILVGIALLISNIITLLLADKMRRRLMLIFSAFGISASLFGIGAFLHLISLEKIACCSSVYNMTFQNCTDPISVTETSVFFNSEDCPKIHTEHIQWLPLLLLMLYIFFFNLGYGALIWMTVVEILPQHVRTVATSFAVSQTCISGFLVSYTYIALKSLITPKWVFWFYGILSVLGLLLEYDQDSYINQNHDPLNNYSRIRITAHDIIVFSCKEKINLHVSFYHTAKSLY